MSHGLERKLEVISRTVETMLGLVENRSTMRVEWYILGLILFELLLSAYPWHRAAPAAPDHWSMGREGVGVRTSLGSNYIDLPCGGPRQRYRCSSQPEAGSYRLWHQAASAGGGPEPCPSQFPERPHLCHAKRRTSRRPPPRCPRSPPSPKRRRRPSSLGSRPRSPAITAAPPAGRALHFGRGV